MIGRMIRRFAFELLFLGVAACQPAPVDAPVT
jgi:hypothetical protein